MCENGLAISVDCFRQGGEQSESYFCQDKSLTMPILRMTSEAKVRPALL